MQTERVNIVGVLAPKSVRLALALSETLRLCMKTIAEEMDSCAALGMLGVHLPWPACHALPLAAAPAACLAGLQVRPCAEVERTRADRAPQESISSASFSCHRR